jgi:hypothetical protein
MAAHVFHFVFRPVFHAIPFRALSLLLACLCAWPVAAESAENLWPQIALPAHARVFEIVTQASVNGLPMQLRGFLSDTAPEQLLTWFRQRMGQPLMESAIGNKRVLGRLQGAHYITLQLEPAGQGTRGLIAVTALASAYSQRAVTEAETARLLSGFPPGSRLLNHIVSSDAGKVSTYVLLTNGQDEASNLQSVKDMMRADGLALENEAISGAAAGARTAFFKGRNREAVAIVYRDAGGQSAIVMNQIHLIVAAR